MFKTLVVAIGLLISSVAARAYCTNLTPKVCDKFFASAAVFLGTAMSEEQIAAPGDFIEGWTYQLRVTRVFRGTVGPIVAVHTGNDKCETAADARPAIFALRNAD